MALEINDATPVIATSNTITAVNHASSSSYETVINGFGGEDKVSVPGGRVTGAVIRGDDIVLKTSYGESTRLANVKGHYIQVYDSAGSHYLHYGGSYTYRPIDVIQKFMASLDKTTLSGSKALDEAIDACSTKFSTIKEAVAQCVADCKAAGNANTFLREYCGIELSDQDTGAITGWDAANPDSKDNEDVVPETGSMKTFSGESFTVNGLKLTVPSSLTSAQQAIVNGLYTWWAKEGLDLITDSYGDNYSFTSSSSATAKEMDVKFVNTKENFLAQVRYYYDSKTGKTVKLELQINMHFYDSISSTDVNGESPTAGAALLDRTLAHEFTHAVMAANINFFSKLPNFIAEGMAELTHGIDDHRYYDIFSLAGSSSKLSKYLNVSDTKSSKSEVYAAGYIFLRYLAKQSAIFEKDYEEVFDWNDPPLAEEGEDGVAYSDGKYTKLIVDDYLGLVDAANFNSKLVTIDATNDEQLVALVGNKNANVLRAGQAGASMDGGLGADKLYGGSGADTFSYSIGGGNDIFYDFDGTDGDIVQIFGDIKSMSYKESGTKGILTVGSGKTKGTITFDKPDGQITIVDGDGETIGAYNIPLPDGLTTDTKKTKLTIAKGAALTAGAVVEADSIATTLKEIDASKFDKSIKLVGNAQANELRAGSAGGTLDGGLGADKIYGGAGADTFSYSLGGGNDIFYDFDGTGGDIVQIFGDVTLNASSYKESGKNGILTVGSGKTKGTITFDKPDGQITIIDGDGETIGAYNIPLPDGLTTDTKKTKLTIAAGAALTAGAVVEADSIAATIKEIDASKFDKSIKLIGNGLANILRAGTVGSSIDGGLGADKIYGGSGADTFAYSIGGGNDIFYNFDGGDIVQIFGDVTLNSSSYKESGKNGILTVGSGKTKGIITFDKPDGQITIIDGDGETIGAYNIPLPDGLTVDTKKTKLTAKDPFRGTIDLADYATTIKEVNATAVGGTVNIIGNAQANVLRAGSAGGTLDGGLGADKIYGGAGADTFSYSIGGGNDIFYNFDGGDRDIVQIFGDVMLNASSYKESGKNGILTVGSGKTKGTITFDKPDGQITIIDGDGETIGAYNIPLPDGLTTDTKKTKLTIAAGAALTAGAVVEADSIAATIKEIDASKFDKSIKLVGNGAANTLRAGTSGSSLDGGLGADKLIGGAGADTFAYSIGGGNDVFYDFDGTGGDIVQILGNVTSMSYNESGTKGTLTITSGKTKGSITFDKPEGQITIIDGDGETIGAYNIPLPEGVSLDGKKIKLTVQEPFSGTIDLANYAATVKEVNATLDGSTVNIIGNDLANTLRAGSAGGSLDGGLGADKLIGGVGIDTFIYNDGDGKDTITGCAEGDVIKIGGTVKSTSVSGKNVILNVGRGSLTVENAVDKQITLDINGSSAAYKFNKSNATLAKAEANASNAQLTPSTDDYWFVGDPTVDPIGDPLDSILEIKTVAVEEPPLSNAALQPSTAALTGVVSSRHASSKKFSY